MVENKQINMNFLTNPHISGERDYTLESLSRKCGVTTRLI